MLRLEPVAPSVDPHMVIVPDTSVRAHIVLIRPRRAVDPGIFVAPFGGRPGERALRPGSSAVRALADSAPSRLGSLRRQQKR